MKTISVNRRAIFYSIIFGFLFAGCIFIWIFVPSNGEMLYDSQDTISMIITVFCIVSFTTGVHIIDTRKAEKGKVKIEKEDERYSVIKYKAQATTRIISLFILGILLILSLYFDITSLKAFSVQLLLLTIICFDMFLDYLLRIVFDKHSDGYIEA